MEDQEKKQSEYRDVHTEHCCINCGCKYGEDRPDSDGAIECTVVSGRQPQSYPCGKTCVCNGW